MLKMKLKDGAVREVAEGTTIAEFVKNVSNSLAKKVLAAKLDGKTVDLMTPLTQDASIAFLTFEDEDGRTYLFFQGNNTKGKTWYLSAVEIGWNDKGPFVKKDSDKFPVR